MRVIGGELRGRRLSSMRGRAIRPTADRVRQALFNILAERPIDAHVLDLFAGSGALGIEAMSRGASRAVFVDNAPAALQVIQKNIVLCRLQQRSQVIRLDIVQHLDLLRSDQGPFDLIFIDPPYRRGLIQPTLRQLAESALAAPDAMAVVEHDPDESFQSPSPRWALADQRRYGQTRLSFLHFSE